MKATALLVALLSGLPGSLAGQEPETRLARDYPDRTRDSVATTIRSALAGGEDADAARATALRLAAAYDGVWNDGFVLERTRWILALRLVDASRFLDADSLRRVGNEQLFRDGPVRARATWRSAGLLFAAIGDSVGVTMIAGNIGASFYEEGLLDSAVFYLRTALDDAERLADHRTAGNAATILGVIAWERGDLRQAMQHNLRAAALHREAGNNTGLAADYNNAGLIAEELGDLDAADRHYRSALAVATVHGTPPRVADYLVNLGGLAAQRGALDSARALFEDALARYASAGEFVNEALARRNLGMLEAGVGVHDGALVQYEAAIRLFGRAGEVRDVVDTRRLLASLHAARGRVDEALEQLSTSDEELARLEPPDPVLAATVATVRGDVELSLNRMDDARGSYATAERLARLAGARDALVAVGLGQAQLALRRAQYGDVVRRLEPVARTQAAGRDRAWSYLLLGAAREGLDDTRSARAALDAALADFVAAGDRPGAALTLGVRAGLEAARGRPHRALQLFADAQDHAAGWPSVQWWLHLGAGQALEAAGDERGALVQYDSAAALVEELAAWLRFDDRRALYLEDKWEPYLAAAVLRARRGDLWGALYASERMRARHLLDLMGRRRSASPAEGALRARERYLRDQIGELTTALLDTEGGRRGPATSSRAATREALLAAQTDYRRLLDRMRTEEPDYVRELRGETATPRAIQGALTADQLLLEYLVTDDRVWIFAVSDTAVGQVSVAVDASAIRAQIDFARWALEQQPERRELWSGALRGLYDVLIRPVRDAGWLAGRRRLIVAPHRELHYLPFEPLIDSTGGRDRYLVERFDVVYVPSASVWLRLRGRSAVGGTAVLALAPRPDVLTGTDAEMDAIASAWGHRVTIRRGAAASEEVLRGARHYRLVHLATRGVLNQYNPLFSYVELAPTEAEDGRLEVHEVFRLHLRTDLLVLSACQTALGSGSVADVPSGDDWVGLVRAFLYAGANHVLATLWAVDDRQTAEIARLIHRRLADGADYAAAVAQAKRDALRTAGLDHPYYWAGFVLTGAP